uniref:Uncharacterized protein n=1 Tax=Saimiri boliviensis boliviensis TaxID=39432 RepID=A0A2K6UBV8_SAIBB
MREFMLTTRHCRNHIGAKVAGTWLALCSWIWSRAPWTPCARGPSGRSSGQTSSSLVSVGPVTTGPMGTTQKVWS